MLNPNASLEANVTIPVIPLYVAPVQPLPLSPFAPRKSPVSNPNASPEANVTIPVVPL